jgi:N-acyl-D-aspartate/D-glutamate deacylase
MTEDYDIIITNAKIVDGTGKKPYKGDIAIKKERIKAIGNKLGTAKTKIDSKGKLATPGFIDVHNHGDLTILYYPKAEGFIKQGITTFIGGQCGGSPAPYGEYVGGGTVLYDLYEKLKPAMYYPNRYFKRDYLNPHHKKAVGWEIDWHTIAEFCKKIEKTTISPNYVPMVGHGNLRILAMGLDYERTATEPEIEAMKPHLKQAFEDGCRGMSVGRDYDPGYWANKNELIELNKIVAEYEGVYQSHSLRTGLRKARRPGEFPPPKINGIMEAIDVGRQAGTAVQISHLSPLYDVYPSGSDIMGEAAAKATLKVIDDAREEGLDVSFDLIPNTGGYGIYANNWLATFLTPWVRVTGSRKQLARALRMKDYREEIKTTIMSGKWYGLNPNINPNWSKRRKIAECLNTEYHEKTIHEIATQKGIDPLEALLEILSEDPYTKLHAMSFASPVKSLFYKHPAMMVGIDTLAIDTKWETKAPPWYKPSQNSFNGYAAYFEDIVREEKILTIEEAVHHATMLPAMKFKLKDRGIIKEGAYADLVIMDLERVKDMSTSLDPCIYPEGIDHVIVNGKQVVDKMKHTGERPGKVLYRE